jgi:hypothetical protein
LSERETTKETAMAKNKVKYLVKGWNVGADGVYRKFSDICENYDAALTYLQLMSVRNVESSHIKVDTIEAIWTVD